MPAMSSLARVCIIFALCSFASLSSSARAATTVSVLYFDNDSGDPSFATLGKGLADMMITDLSNVPGIQVVEREKLEAVLSELKLQRTRYFDPKTAQKIGKGLAAEYVVTGSFVSVAPMMRLDVRMIRITTGEIVKAQQVTGKKDEFFDLYQRLCAGLLEGLPNKVARPKATGAPDVKTALDYAEALDLRDRGDLQGASQKMQKTMQQAPGFGLAKSRYMQIMKELYAAKDARTDALSGSEKALSDSIDRHLANPADDSHLAYRIIRGSLLAKRVAAKLSGPGQQIRAPLAAYQKNQEALIRELVAIDAKTEIEFNPGIDIKSVDYKDGALLKELGIPFPKPTTANAVMLDLVGTLGLGILPVEGAKAICFAKLDPSFMRTARALLKPVALRIELRANHNRELYRKNKQPTAWADNELAAGLIDVVQTEAQLDVMDGKREEAIAKLQGLLTRYPKAKQFEETEQMIRGILDGSDKLPDGRAIVGCENPR